MILRHAREAVDGQPIENSFEAIDERSGAYLGGCTIYDKECPQLFPARPRRIYIDIQGETAPDALLGAAVARAKELARQARQPSRVFTQVEPNDEELMASLSLLGFKDSDGLVCMRRKLPCSPPGELPIGCVVVRDNLDDPIEQKYFLERYNLLFNEAYDFEWLQSFRNKKNFKRLLIVAPTGMVGECIIWREGEAGMIGWLHASKKWRRKGVGRLLLELACDEFSQLGLARAEAEVQARVPGLLRVMEAADFHQAKLILRYPGVDIG